MIDRNRSIWRHAALFLFLGLLTFAGRSTSAAGEEPALAANPLQFVQGHDVWVPGWTFSDGNDWLALFCSESACQLVEAALRVRVASWQGHHDEVGTAGQRLEFRLSIDTPGRVMAWIRRDASLPWLRPGAIEGYYAYDLNPVVQDEADTYEIVIATPGDSVEVLAPVLRVRSGPDDERSLAFPGAPVYLQLRARGARQLLSERMAVCTGDLDLEYLLWSGDLDRDGRADYLVDYTDSATGSVKFYLSSYAQPGDLVGEAGAGVTHPLDGDCA